MGKAILIVVLGITLVAGKSLTGLNERSLRLNQNTARHYEDLIARNIAESGANIGFSLLRRDPHWTGPLTNRQFHGGQGSVMVSDAGNTIALISTGNSGGVSKTVSLKFKKISNSVPPPMRYALFSDGNLHMDKQIVHVLDDGNGMNADLHSNNNLHVGSKALVKGFGTYGGSFGGSNGVFNPYSNPEGLAVVHRMSWIPVPLFVASEHADIANRISASGLTLSGNIALGTKENPTFWYINGNLTISGAVSGYGAFMVTGDITVNSNLTINVPDHSKSTVGLYAQGNVHFHANVSLEAQIWAGGNVHFDGAATLYGTVVSANNIHFNGLTKVYYRPANALLTQPVWEEEYGAGAEPGDFEALQFLSWQE